MLCKFVQEKKENWDTFLDTCVFAYNTSRHESTLHTPFEVMFGRQATLPVDVEMEGESQLLPDATVGDDYENAMEDILSHRRDICQKVKENIVKAQIKQKEAYDRKHACPSSFKIGDVVLKKDNRRKKRKGGKLDPKWVGPYTIIGDLGKGSYRLELVEDPEFIERANGSHLKIYSRYNSLF